MLENVKSRNMFTLVPCNTPVLNVDSPMLQSDDSRNVSISLCDSNSIDFIGIMFELSQWNLIISLL